MRQLSSYPLSILAHTLKVSRHAYYHHLKNMEVKRRQDEALKNEVEIIILDCPGYGYRRITKELKNKQIIVNHKKVLRIMRNYNLLCTIKRKFITTTDSNHHYYIYPNLIKNLILTGINQLWVADITYIRTHQGFVYLAVILDAYSGE